MNRFETSGGDLGGSEMCGEGHVVQGGLDQKQPHSEPGDSRRERERARPIYHPCLMKMLPS